MCFISPLKLIHKEDNSVIHNRRALISFLFVSLLSACSRPTHTVPYFPPVVKGIAGGAAAGAVIGSAGGFGVPIGTGVGAALGTIIGYDIQSRRPDYDLLQDQMRHYGIQLVRIGEDQRIIIPADRLFYGNSPRMKRDGEKLLSLVIHYMCHYQFVSAKVSGYTDNFGSHKRNQVLSQARASTVAEFLSQDYFDTRMIFASGYGDSLPIAANDHALGRAYNRRIEITYRVLPTRHSTFS